MSDPPTSHSIADDRLHDRRAHPSPVAETPGMRARPTLRDFLALAFILHDDEGRSDAELQRRDREIGLRLQREQRTGTSRAARLVAWIRLQQAGDTRAAAHVADAIHVAGVVLAALAGGFGVIAVIGAFAFQPEGRINVVGTLAVLVGMQWLFLLLAVLGGLPPRARRFVPGLGRGSHAGSVFQPARWALMRLPQTSREGLDMAWGFGRAWERQSADVRRWLLLRLSQGAAVVFNVGAIACAMCLVVFTDLSFGWSTTLEIDVATATSVAQAIAWPWSAVWPGAVPSEELLSTTRYFRIAGSGRAVAEPESFGLWWPFVVMTLAVYGLLPRLVFLGIARLRLAAAIRRAIERAPGSRRILERMERPLVETASVSDGIDEPGASEGVPGPLPTAHAPERAVILNWSGALVEPKHDSRARPVTVGAFDVGGGSALAEDDRVIEEVCSIAMTEDVPILIYVRGFEPPLLECLDFIRSLRQRLHEGHEVLVTPIGGSSRTRDVWAARLTTLGDPWVRFVDSEPIDG